MLAPHWLDNIFADPSKAEEALLGSDQFKLAIAKAQEAFKKGAELTTAPPIPGQAPMQLARVEFLRVINDP